MDDELRRTAEFIDDVAASTRSRLRLFWFPMAAFGLVMLGAAIFAVLFAPNLLWFYWVFAGSAAGLATARHYRRRETEMGLIGPTFPYLASSLFLGAGAFALPLLISSDPAWAISVWTGIGYLLFAVLERSLVVAGVAALFVVLGLIFMQVEVNNEIVWVSALSGIALLAGAAVLWPKAVMP